MQDELNKIYEPHSVEEKWYKYWLEKKYFHASVEKTENKKLKNKKPYSIVIPPPNVTGSLHMGHALNNTLQDILIRWKRMQGYNTLWMPGTDHAGIATQNIVERMLNEEGLKKEDLGREEFLKRVWAWKEKSGGMIINQLKRLGCSCDWDRERFTLDEGLSQAVREVFVRLFNEGMIYQENYIINFCPRCKTALSDIEVEHNEEEGHLWYIKYFIKNSLDFIEVATTRPETALGDTAVAVNPDDERYKALIGQTVILPIIGREIPIIGDIYVDTKFGTGAVKITPAHDLNDFEVAKRHNLEKILVMNKDGSMNENAGKYNGLDRYKCREEFVNDLNNGGFLSKTESYKLALGRCYRCKTAVEPYLSKQWFVRIKGLSVPAINAVKKRKVKIIPSSWNKTYFEWMNNIRDWCISRQLWWGHRIPVWYCQNCGRTNVSVETPKNCECCQSTDLIQDPDVLDTWFSSGLWPFSTLGWPLNTEELKTFYPTSVLVTGFDILFFWVARMIMLGLKFVKDVPFNKVYIHALVRDGEGQKMSKSRGNVIDPLVMMDKYGTDAFRFTLAAFAAQGRDICLAEDRISGYRNFANKIWNASRFVLMNLKDYKPSKNLSRNLKLILPDKWIISRLNQVTGDVTKSLNSFHFNDAALILYHFIWHEYCDWYVELAKDRLYNPEASGEEKTTVQYILLHTLEQSLRLLHPFMPFITEEIWQRLPVSNIKSRVRSRESEISIMTASWPKVNKNRVDLNALQQMGILIEIITNIRNIRGEMKIPPGAKTLAWIKINDKSKVKLIDKHIKYIMDLTRSKEVKIIEHITKTQDMSLGVLLYADIYVQPEIITNDKNIEKNRLLKEIEKTEKELKFTKSKLDNESFLKKAPKEVVENEKIKFNELETIKNKLEKELNLL
ncbi:MAG: valine--tRNA ligase [Candidatus Firestonebacteria bacterium]|nr:valine--tRNA ligase [Candidatus Firestonebacteria bacterium]